MSRRQARNLLNIASEQVPQGIYAVEFSGYIEMLNMPMSSEDIKAKRKELGRQGIRVYANG